MTIRANSIRLFVSSTFTDFLREREALDTHVFPQIKAYCTQRGYEFLPVDLRWGISEMESRSQLTLRICLNEVTRCVQTSLRPYFLILTGDRYGWQPLPLVIRQPEFEKLRAYIVRHEGRNRAVFGRIPSMLSRWYRLDLNHVPPQYVLQSRREGTTEGSPRRWTETEQRLREALRHASQGIGLPCAAGRKYVESVTAQEVWRGVLSKPKEQGDFKDHVFCFRRRRLRAPPSTPLSPDPDFNDLQPGDGTLDREAGAHLAALHRRLHRALGDNVLVYDCFPDTAAGLAEYESAFKGDATRLLKNAVKSQIDQLEPSTSYEKEWLRHSEFGQGLARRVAGREDLIGRLDAFLDRRDGRGMIVHGPGGIGKSTLMAKAAAMARDADPRLLPPRGLVTLERYLGTSSESSQGFSLIAGLIRELAVGMGGEWQPPSDIRTLGNELRRLLSDASPRVPRGIVLIIDGLDQLHPDDPARQLEWLPWPVPPNVLLLVSVANGDLLPVVEHRMSGAESLSVTRLVAKAGEDILRSLLRESHRRLQPSQLQLVISRWDGSPLYLRVAANMVKEWPAYQGAQPLRVRLPKSTTRLIDYFFNDLADRRHGRPMVSKVACFLVASRQGLAEHELLSLLWDDPQVKEAALQRAAATGHDWDGLKGLPMILWARLRDELEPYLVERAADGTTVLAFFHRVFEDAVRDNFFATSDTRGATHRALARHFGADRRWMLDPVEDSPARPNLRKLAELPYQHIALHDGEAMRGLLEDVGYRRAKRAAGLEEELYNEFHACDRLLNGSGDAAPRSRLAELLTDHVAGTIHSVPSDEVTSFVEALHAAFIYREDTSFYATFLRICIARLRTSHQRGTSNSAETAVCLEARLANLLRRKPDLDAAQTLLNAVLPQLRRRGLHQEVSRAEYDNAYIAFLRGNLKKAGVEFRRSAATARRAGSAVSEWISLCLAANVRWIDMLSRREHRAEADRFGKVLDAAEAVFRDHVLRDVNAARWIFNVRVNRFRIAFRMRDDKLALLMRQAIQGDAWARQYEPISNDDAIMDAKLAILAEQYEQGADALLVVTRRLPEGWEALAELYFDAGVAYSQSDRPAQALQAWDSGLNLAPEVGNVPWQRLIREARRPYSS
jgi:tetratricopeptide (TPR) repeat protein